MSHFSVAVFTPEEPNEERIAEALRPWHEFECTGVDDQYVVPVDETEEALAEYAAATRRFYRDPQGNQFDAYADQFYREPTAEEFKKIGPIAGTGGGGGLSWHSKDWKDGRGYRTKIHFLPEGWEEVDIKVSELEDFGTWASGYYGREIVNDPKEIDISEKHKYGYILCEKSENLPLGAYRVIDRTNPNKRWDWWVIGGRWSDSLLTLDGKVADFAPVAEIDLPALKFREQEKRRGLWKKSLGKANGEESAALDTMRRLYYRAAKEEQEKWLKIKGDRRAHFLANMPQDLLAYENIFNDFRPITTDADIPIEDWIEAAPALQAFAVVRDGQWYQRGLMGWWGCVSDEKDKAEWEREFQKLLESSPANSWVTIVDCHI